MWYTYLLHEVIEMIKFWFIAFPRAPEMAEIGDFWPLSRKLNEKLKTNWFFMYFADILGNLSEVIRSGVHD